MQICYSLDFPGRYTCRGKRHDVPIGAVSVVDAWEPHAVSDPIDRERLSHYIVIYLDAHQFRTAVDHSPAAPLDAIVHTGANVARRFTRFHRALAAPHSLLRQDERYRELAHALLSRRGDDASAVIRPARGALTRARDFIAAHAADRIGLDEIAAIADLTPWHLTRAFRRQFGYPPHRFQVWMRIDLARRLLAGGMSGSDVAQQTGFADQSHFIRSFKRLTGTTPSMCEPVRRAGRVSRW